MARYAVFGDIHGNLEAWLAVKQFLETQSIDEYICCGDIVGYGPNSKEVLEEIASLEAICVKGNHDRRHSVVINPILYEDVDNELVEDDDIINARHRLYKRTIRHTQEQLTEQDMLFLKSLRYKMRIGEMIISHGSPVLVNDFLYIRDKNQQDTGGFFIQLNKVQDHMRRVNIRFLFYGHSHQPVTNIKYLIGNVPTNLKTQEDTDLNKLPKNGKMVRCLVNVGSVGQPRDGDNRACVVIYDDETRKIEYHRIPYDFRTTQRKMEEIGLGGYYSQRLSVGK